MCTACSGTYAFDDPVPLTHEHVQRLMLLQACNCCKFTFRLNIAFSVNDCAVNQYPSIVCAVYTAHMLASVRAITSIAQVSTQRIYYTAQSFTLHAMFKRNVNCKLTCAHMLNKLYQYMLCVTLHRLARHLYNVSITIMRTSRIGCRRGRTKRAPCLYIFICM